MESCPRPEITYPTRVPLKVIGKAGVLEPARVEALILEHLGPQAAGDGIHAAHEHGAYIAYTFWVTLPSEQAERPLREAILALPGYVMQL